MNARKIIIMAVAAAAALLSSTNGLKAQNMEGNKVLVAYFSATGTTQRAAKLIAEATGGTLYEITPAQKYTSADLDWHDRNSRSSVEMKDEKSRPEIAGAPENLEQYDTVFIGFPIWWYTAPRIINTFIESNDLFGKTVIPFATSGGSTITDSEADLRKAYPTLNWKSGKLLNGMTLKDVQRWVQE